MAIRVAWAASIEETGAPLSVDRVTGSPSAAFVRQTGMSPIISSDIVSGEPTCAELAGLTRTLFQSIGGRPASFSCSFSVGNGT